MILVLCSAGHVAVAVREAIESIREAALLGDLSTKSDVFGQARRCRAIVYAPEPRLLDSAGMDVSNLDRIREVVRAAHAPSVERVTVVTATDCVWEQEERILEQAGVAYTVIRCAPLLDELADATNLHTTRSVWLPRGREVELATRSALATTIRSALFRDDPCGATVFVPTVRTDLVEAMRRAAAIAGAGVRVHASVPGVSSVLRRVRGWVERRPALDVEALCDRLVPRSWDRARSGGAPGS